MKYPKIIVKNGKEYVEDNAYLGTLKRFNRKKWELENQRLQAVNQAPEILELIRWQNKAIAKAWKQKTLTKAKDTMLMEYWKISFSFGNKIKKANRLLKAGSLRTLGKAQANL